MNLLDHRRNKVNLLRTASAADTETQATWVEEDRCVLWAEGEVTQATNFGEHLVLRRRIEADFGGAEIRVHDVVRNAGFDRTPHMFLYHINLGWPLLDAGTRFIADISRTTWQTDSVVEQGVDHLRFDQPIPGFIEQVYEHELRPRADGLCAVGLVNESLAIEVSYEFDPQQFPCFFQWLNLREGGWAVGLEPSTHHVGGDAAARSDGTMIWLEHDEARSYTSRFVFSSSRPER